MIGFRYSVLLTAHNEADNLRRLVPEICAVLDSLVASKPAHVAPDRVSRACHFASRATGDFYEVLVIDDGSADHTRLVLDDLARDYPELRVISFSRNCGQSAALDAGFRHARGDVLILLDADGQNPPSEIPRLLAALDNADMACGRRIGRCDTLAKRIASRIANAVRRAVLNDGVHDTGCSLKAIRREAVSRLKLFHGLHRFLPALVQIEGYRVVEIPVSHRPRTLGTSHYGIWNRILAPLCDLAVVCWMQRRCRRWRVQNEFAGRILNPSESVIDGDLTNGLENPSYGETVPASG